MGDTLCAMGEFTLRIFMNGMNTSDVRNTCEGSRLTAPLVLDFFVFTEIEE